MVHVRLFNATQAEYEKIAAVHHTIWPDEKQFPAELWQEEDREWPEGVLQQRFVLEREGKIIGWGVCFEKYWQHQPGTVHIEFHVLASYQEDDQLLYKAMLDFLNKREPKPKTIAAEAREDRQWRIRFLEQHGFKALMRTPRSTLQVSEFDERPFDALLNKLNDEGIKIINLAEMKAFDPDWKQNLYELRWTIVQDVPAVEPPTRPTMAEFEQMILDDPALHEAAWFVAVDTRQSNGESGDGRYVGMSNLWINDPAHQRLDTGLTGVVEAYRRRGIATALKVRAVQFAKAFGAQTIETDNEENNPVIDINNCLGFQAKAAWVSYRKDL